MSPSSAYAKTLSVASYDVGADRLLTVPALLRGLHDTAQAHAALHGFGYQDLFSRKLAWALVTIELRCSHRPPGDASWMANTAVSRAVGPLVFRDYVATSNGHRFAAGQALWALIDLDTRKTAVQPNDLRQTLSGMSSNLQEEVRAVRRLRQQAPLPEQATRTVRIHDCDFNGHLNNVVAARWLLDGAYEYRPQLQKLLQKMHLTYHHEALLGEDLCVGVADMPDGELRVDLRRTDGLLVANGAFA